ncbi:toxin-antitoxin system TumE family protein [Pseudomonas moraviensis]|uniref:Uncharacterized protein n=1 Tax=Pseudomonas moraviensis TaxID=321662 RepID=A0A7Y9VSD8_9PSED|nr:DUF6516 family protein [Pseudomonas moraviensis]NYH07634.1 hypothetical protein [Pseudomonas moraviensis]
MQTSGTLVFSSYPDRAIRSLARGRAVRDSYEAIGSNMAAKKGGKKKEPRLERFDDSFVIPDKKGNGQIRIQYLKNAETGQVITYSMAYINATICPVDNGRVIGYDNAHGEHHKHDMGVYVPVEFESLERTLELFQDQWHQYLKLRKSK